MSFTLIRSAAGFALLAAVAAGCGTAVAAHSQAVKPPAAVHQHPAPLTHEPSTPARTHRHVQAAPVHPAASTPAAAPATTPAHTANPIPQGNGGDQDADNNGGPSDGDGNI
jgi:hypothetical protein